MIIEKQIAQIYGMSLVLRHEVSEDNIMEEYKLLLIIAEFAQNILKLFELAGRNLDINEVTVGYYRKFKEVKTKKQIMVKLCNMARGKNPKIKSVGQGKGVYGVIK